MNITGIGSGNVATHLLSALHAAGHRILQVYSPQAAHAQVLASKLAAEAISDPRQITLDADIYIISVKDDAVKEVAASLSVPGRIVVHTSGGLSLNELSACSEHHGVFYPLQTFSRNRELNFREIPVFIEASDAFTLEALQTLAGSVSDQVFEADSERRMILHVAAVFAGNFSNHLYALSAAFLEEKGLSFDILRPLIRETTAKISTLSPADAQTGPAARKDFHLMQHHLQVLADQPHLQHIYKLLSDSIMKSRE